MTKKILFIVGSMNQTLQMHQISRHLPEYECWFTQFFSDSKIVNLAIKYTPILDKTILSGQFKANSEQYLVYNNLNIDYKARKNRYDLVVYCEDMLIHKRFRSTKTVWVQEGMTDRMTVMSKIVKALRLSPSFTLNTSLNGTSSICDVYCAGSEGYKAQFARLGTAEEKIVVTGIPNYDNAVQFINNDFPYRDYVMVATTDMRETFRLENRPAFIRKAVAIANGRRLLFKLHPNEKFERAEREIKKHAPADTLIFQKGNTNHMIANCAELITQYSTVVYIGLALGKKVHSWFDIEELRRLAPLQNGGTSAARIAEICRQLAGPSLRKADTAKELLLEQSF